MVEVSRSIVKTYLDHDDEPKSQEEACQSVADNPFSLEVSLLNYAAYQHRSPISGFEETPDL